MLRLELSKNQYRSLVNYAIGTCDSFSLVFEKDDVDRAKYIHQTVYAMLADSVLSRMSIGIHPDTKTHFAHSDIVYFECNKQTGSIFKTANTFFEWDGTLLPEELCFYRKEEVWCACVCHEKQVVVFNETPKDIKFLIDNKIDYWCEGC